MSFFESIFGSLNSKGIPLPMARDPRTQLASGTFTFFVISGLLCAGCSVIALTCALSKSAGIFQSFTEAQKAVMDSFSISFQFFLASGGFYLGHSFSRNAQGTISVEGSNNGKKQGQGVSEESPNGGSEPG